MYKIDYAGQEKGNYKTKIKYVGTSRMRKVRDRTTWKQRSAGYINN